MNVNFDIPPLYVLGPGLIAFAAATAVRARRSQPGWTGRHAGVRIAAAVYAAAVLSITVFPITVTWGEYASQTPWYNQINFIPLITFDVTAVPNVIMFVPFGMLLPLISRVSGVLRATAVSLLASLSIELAQLLSYVLFNNGRACDVNDLLANALGGLIGWLLVRAALGRPSPAALLRDIALPGSAAYVRRTAVAPV
ncbi:VanZ family protein [Streptomyces sp. P9-A2]|uniref:VanZ family protein n=1 Tax=Streptomyces sp. P9-A2 TaxID=3072284 RepID=UPI002FCC255F